MLAQRIRNVSKVYPSILKTNRLSILYEHDTGEPGVITEQWFTGGVMNRHTRIRIYIDGEVDASLDFNLFIAHGLGFPESDDLKNIPWGTRRIAHTADGGICNTIRIPLSKSFRVTATTQSSGYIWYIIHLDNAGLTYKGKGRTSGYKFFENDPLLFTKSFELWWRCSDEDISRDKHVA